MHFGKLFVKLYFHKKVICFNLGKESALHLILHMKNSWFASMEKIGIFDSIIDNGCLEFIALFAIFKDIFILSCVIGKLIEIFNIWKTCEFCENLGYLKTTWKFVTWIDCINMWALYVSPVCCDGSDYPVIMQLDVIVYVTLVS